MQLYGVYAIVNVIYESCNHPFVSFHFVLLNGKTKKKFNTWTHHIQYTHIQPITVSDQQNNIIGFACFIFQSCTMKINSNCSASSSSSCIFSCFFFILSCIWFNLCMCVFLFFTISRCTFIVLAILLSAVCWLCDVFLFICLCRWLFYYYLEFLGFSLLSMIWM